MDKPKRIGVGGFGMIPKRKDITYEEFKYYWINHHSKIERDIINRAHRSIIKAKFVEGMLKDGKLIKEKDIHFDGWVEILYETVEDLAESVGPAFPEVLQRLNKDEKNFVDHDDPIRGGYLVEEWLMAERE
jgi:hypothetical protein